MGLFDKKYCDVCGEKIGLLGNRKLADGNLCKNCAKKLSPWFSDRRSSTVQEIKEQLAYREENRKKVAQFRVTKSFGEDMKVLIDETHLWFMVARAESLTETNPDVIDFSALVDCSMNVEEHRTEVTRIDKDGKRVSYVPPRYEFRYDFDILIRVNTPYFDEIKFQLNGNDVRVISEMPGSTGFFGENHGVSIDPSYNVEYRKYMRMSEELCDALREIRCVMDAGAKMQQISDEKGSLSLGDIARAYGYDPAMFAESRTANATAPITPSAPAAPAAGPWTCPACGAPNNGKFCEFCGSPRPQ